MAKTPPPEVPRGELTPQALGLWFTRFAVWSKEMDGRTLALEDAPAAEASVAADDGTDYNSYRHKPGNSSLSTWNIAGSVGSSGTSAFAAWTANNDTLFAIPFLAPKRGGAITALAYESNAAAGSSRIAVYTNTAADNLYPNAFLGETGSQTNLGGPTLISVSSLSIGPLTAGGLYWLAFNTNNAAAQIRTLNAASTNTMLGHPFAGGTAFNVGITVASTYGTPPSTFPAGGAYLLGGTNLTPALGYRVS